MCANEDAAVAGCYHGAMQLSFSQRIVSGLRTLWLVVFTPVLVALVAYVLLSVLTIPGWMILIPLFLLSTIYVYRRSRSRRNQAVSYTPQTTELAFAKAQLQHLFEHSPVPYLRIDQAGNVLMANLAAVRLFGATTETVTTIRLFERIQTDPNAELSVLLGKLESGVSIDDLEFIISTLGGEERWVRMSIYVAGINAPERLVTLVDITQQKRIDQAKSEFVALAAHQLRTPIAAIRWNVELLESTDLSSFVEKQRSYLGKVARNAARMMTLINDFLSVSKLETGTFEADPETVDFTAYLGEIIDEFAALVSQKQLEVTLHPPAIPATATADMRLLHIVTSNLISNACKYTPAQGRVTVTYTTDGTTITFTVKDAGIGVPQSEQGRLFSKFFRATNARKHRQEGTGLGLYIVKQSAEMMGGTIAMQSTEGQGSTFIVTFPMQPAPQA